MRLLEVLDLGNVLAARDLTGDTVAMPERRYDAP
jgi:hypothetical protein